MIVTNSHKDVVIIIAQADFPELMEALDEWLDWVGDNIKDDPIGAAVEQHSKVQRITNELHESAKRNGVRVR